MPIVRSTRTERVRAKGPSSPPASHGATTQARAAIGSAAAAQMPRIFAREYCSVCLSLNGLSSVGSPTPPRAICPSELIFFDPPCRTGVRWSLTSSESYSRSSRRGQVAVLHLHVASSCHATRAPYSWLRKKYVLRSTKLALRNFLELCQGEVCGMILPRTPVNKDEKRKGRSLTSPALSSTSRTLCVCRLSASMY